MTSTITFGTGYDDRGKKITIDTRGYSTERDSVPEGHWKIGREEGLGELTKKKLKDLLDGSILIDEIDEARKHPTTITVNNLRGGTNELEIVNTTTMPGPDIDSILAFANQGRVLKIKKNKKVTKKRKSAKKPKKVTKKRKSAKKPKKVTKKRKSAKKPKKVTKKRKSAKKNKK